MADGGVIESLGYVTFRESWYYEALFIPFPPSQLGARLAAVSLPYSSSLPIVIPRWLDPSRRIGIGMTFRPP